MLLNCVQNKTVNTRPSLYSPAFSAVPTVRRENEQYLTEREQNTPPALYMLIISTRNSSGDEIANVNFLYDNIVHALQNTIDSCINSAT